MFRNLKKTIMINKKKLRLVLHKLQSFRAFNNYRSKIVWIISSF